MVVCKTRRSCPAQYCTIQTNWETRETKQKCHCILLLHPTYPTTHTSSVFRILEWNHMSCSLVLLVRLCIFVYLLYFFIFVKHFDDGLKCYVLLLLNWFKRCLHKFAFSDVYFKCDVMNEKMSLWIFKWWMIDRQDWASKQTVIDLK